MFHCPAQYRLRTGHLASDDSYGNNGAFLLPTAAQSRPLQLIASDGLAWEHVSVTALHGRTPRLPTWHEMCRVKDLFWDAEDVVMQLHPRASQYVNTHPTVLHLWRPTAPGVTIPEPPPGLVGVPDLEIPPSALREREL